MMHIMFSELNWRKHNVNTTLMCLILISMVSHLSRNQWLPRHKWTCGGGRHHVILQTSSYEEIHPVFWRKINFDNYINISCPLFFYLIIIIIWTINIWANFVPINWWCEGDKHSQKDRMQHVWCSEAEAKRVKLNDWKIIHSIAFL